MPGFLPVLHRQQPQIWPQSVFQHFQPGRDPADHLEMHEE